MSSWLPQVIYLIIVVAGGLKHYQSDGERMSSEYNFRTFLLFHCVIVLLLNWGGFFGE